MKLSAQFESIKAQLIRIISAYVKQNPQQDFTPILFKILVSSGFSDEDAKEVTELAKHQGDIRSFFSALSQT